MSKYEAFKGIKLKDRQWPDRTIGQTPQWCSVDLRDGNQALVNPMGVEQKLSMFALLARIGFKQIEIGFPSASQIEFDFCRRLIDEKRIPEGVAIQVLCQAREHLVERTVEALQGAKDVIFHLYSSTSPAHRNYTFGMSREQVRELAVEGVAMVRSRLGRLPGARVILEYSPESFSQTEPEFALEICEAVRKAWEPEEARPLIFNLPATVEVCMPNQHADQIEWFCRNIGQRQSVTVSLHTHNDRGTGVAAAELGILAGADRVEGTLFGNGERTGNLDIVTLALNLFSQGVDTGLDFSDLPAIVDAYENLTGMSVPSRQPYAGELVFTAFSGSHQDAIKKALDKREEALAAKGPGASAESVVWDIPYIPLDPLDIGRTWDRIIRINSQSGKGGVAYVLKERFQLDLPKAMHPDVGRVINEHADASGTELSAEKVWEIFQREFLNREGFMKLISFRGESTDAGSGETSSEVMVRIEGQVHRVVGTGSGPIAAFVNGLKAAGINGFEVVDFHEDAITTGADSQAAAYLRIRDAKGLSHWGCGIDKSITIASYKALIQALNRAKA
jgi:2-isopropylmalate synthase